MTNKVDRANWKVLFAVGPGDTVSSYDEWARGDSKGAAISLTYTAQTLDFCRDTGVQAWLISSCERQDIRRAPGLVIENRPKVAHKPGALGFHWQQWAYYCSLARTAKEFGATHVVVDSGTSHWFSWGLLSLQGIKVYVSFHNTYYTIGHWRPSFVRNLVRRLDGWFFKRCSDGALGVSEECRAQYAELGGDAARCVVYNALFEPHDFVGFEARPLDSGLRRIAYVGRVDANKGAFDLITAFEQLCREHPNLPVMLDYCGEGIGLPELRARIQSSDILRDRVILHGQLKRPELLDIYRQCHVVVVPTTSNFMEGFPKVCAEAVLTKRPLIISSAVPTIDGLRKAALTYPCDHPQELQKALLELLTDADLYREKSHQAGLLGHQFFDVNKGLNQALQSIMR